MRRCLLQRIEGTRWVFLGPVGTDGMFPRYLSKGISS
jgi:hypothetical protein